MSRPVAVLAGGRATRLGAVASAVPKCLVDVAGRPFLHHQLALLRRAGIGRVVLCVGHLGDQVAEACGDGRLFGLHIDYAWDGEVPRGTAGALADALPLLGETFFVLYGDAYLDVDYGAVSEAFDRSRALGLMTVYRNRDRWDRSNVLFRDGRIVAYDKSCPERGSEHIDYGLGVLHREALRGVESPGSHDLTAVYQRLIERGELAGEEVFRRFFEVGSLDGLEEFRAKLSREQADRMATFSKQFLTDIAEVAVAIDIEAVERLVAQLVAVRERGGRLFVLGSGGGAGHASHAVCDLRKLAGIEAYAPTDNVSELTARINDEGWDTSLANWLRVSRLSADDLVMVFSVGGGDEERNISPNLVRALDLAKEVGCPVCGVVGRDGGATARSADACVVVPTVSPALITPLTESFQAIIWHLAVSHPALQTTTPKWEAETA